MNWERGFKRVRTVVGIVGSIVVIVGEIMDFRTSSGGYFYFENRVLDALVYPLPFLAVLWVSLFLILPLVKFLRWVWVWIKRGFTDE